MKMKGTNRCPWLKVNTLETCGKSCVNEYCNTHRQQLRKGRTPPISCRHCGVRRKLATQLCGLCGLKGVPVNERFILIIIVSVLMDSLDYINFETLSYVQYRVLIMKLQIQ